MINITWQCYKRIPFLRSYKLRYGDNPYPLEFITKLFAFSSLTTFIKNKNSIGVYRKFAILTLDTYVQNKQAYTQLIN